LRIAPRYHPTALSRNVFAITPTFYKDVTHDGSSIFFSPRPDGFSL